ncbi:hypothetical protein ACFQE1_07865 [Halobium palmae]|uniref:DUF35 domain-containing protein n=1 Tax=Halobium palmae TaxID=1776492 RepID=A0ABD5RXW1_9EURY
MSTDPGTTNDASVDSARPADDRLRCYQCDHRYSYLGDDQHPGVCPDCGSRLVSFAGEPRAVAPREGLAGGSARRLSPVFKVIVSDETDRRFEYFVALPERGGDGPVPILRYVRVEDHRTYPTGENWDDGLVPRGLLHVVRQLTGTGLLVPTDDASTDGDDGEGGIGVGRDP